MGDVHISGEAMAVFSGMLTAVVGGLVALFWLGWRERDARIKDLQSLNTQLTERQALRFQELLTAIHEVKASITQLHGRQP